MCGLTVYTPYMLVRKPSGCNTPQLAQLLISNTGNAN